MDEAKRLKLVKWLNQNKVNQHAKKLLLPQLKKSKGSLDESDLYVVQLMEWGLEKAGLEKEMETPVVALVRSMYHEDPNLIMGYLTKTWSGGDLPLQVSQKDTAESLAWDLLNRVRDRLGDSFAGSRDNLNQYKP